MSNILNVPRHVLEGLLRDPVRFSATARRILDSAEPAEPIPGCLYSNAEVQTDHSVELEASLSLNFDRMNSLPPSPSPGLEMEPFDLNEDLNAGTYIFTVR